METEKGKMRRKLRKRIPRGESMRKGIYLLPNFLTSCSLFCGFYSIVHTHHLEFLHASWAILIALVFDALDGKIARFTNTSSQFGVEYDSLADLVSFGVAPAYLVYVWALTPLGRPGWMGAMVFVLCAALRLARYNVQIETVESRNFNGLPVPAAAAVIASFIILYLHVAETFHWGSESFYFRLTEGISWKNILILFMPYLLAFLMISSVKYYAFKDLGLLKRRQFSFFALFIIVIAFILIEYHLAFFLLATGYAFSGPFNFLIYSRVKTLSAMFRDR